ncbi:hypothetical protein EVAR_8445_1 [Eumeta japonica]|uniref:Uncharacterized protein n=1 Tax=Eumeta variegata TaxID=151549 RepID=A0A4C1WFC9_EUMVA|nr:hypothetical protein EVAR_8445_1 [Eumeta japonica]
MRRIIKDTTSAAVAGPAGTRRGAGGGGGGTGTGAGAAKNCLHLAGKNSASDGHHVYCMKLRLGVTLKSVTLGNVTMSHRTRERPAECLASLSHSTMIGLPRAAQRISA